MQRVPANDVPLDNVAFATYEENAIAESGRFERQRGRREVAIVGDQIGDNARIAFRREELGVERVRHEPYAVAAEYRTRDHHAAGVGAAVAERIIFRHDVMQHGAARLALAHVKAGVGRPAGV